MGALSLRNLAIAVLIALPYTKSLSLPIGFALKPYEILLPLLLVAALSEGQFKVGRSAALVRTWWIFLFASLFPTAWGFLAVLELDLTFLEWATGRFSPAVNVIFHTVYLTLDILLLVVFLTVMQRRVLTMREMAYYWTWGSVISVGYAVWLNLVNLAGLPLAVALRFAPIQTIDVMGLRLVRSGPFEEGNFFGLYLVVSLTFALWAQRRYPHRLFDVSIVALALGIFMSASPAAMVSMLILLAAASLRGGVPRAIKIMQVGVGVALIALVLNTNLLQELVIEKFSLLLVGGVTDSGNVSLVRRVNETVHAWWLFRDYPMGVGIGNFGYFWGNYPEYYPWLQVAFTTKKQIPNNVYLEVLTEQGIAGFVIFMGIQFTMLRALVRRRAVTLSLGLVATLAYFFVFPTFRLAFLWVFWAVLMHAAYEREESRSPL